MSSRTDRYETSRELHSAAIHLLRRLRVQDMRSGLGAARLSALSVLVYGGPQSLTELAAAEQVRLPTVSRLVAALEREGLVTRRPDERDARVVRIQATPRGRRMLLEGQGRRLSALVSLMDGLSDEEVTTLMDASRLIQRLTAKEWVGARSA
jgi:DNA-binding MarR family transcriptional regulator